MATKFKNLEAEMVRTGLGNEDLANELNLSTQTFRRKLNGEIKFSIGEAKKIKERIEQASEEKFTIDFLFAE